MLPERGVSGKTCSSAAFEKTVNTPSFSLKQTLLQSTFSVSCFWHFSFKITVVHAEIDTKVHLFEVV